MTGNQLQKFDGTPGGDLAKSSGGIMSTQVVGRQAAEVQAAMVIAKNFPRDIVQAERRIAVACQRIGLAQQAFYSYPKGGTKVSGPSIRMAEMLAQSWGNMESGIVELERRENESTVMAFAWDYETNTRETKTFAVPHEIKTKAAGIKKLTDPRDIYEHIANMGARRRRSCILGIIPVDVQDNAVAQCQKTLAGQGGGKPLIDRVKEWVLAFERFGITPEHIEKRLGHNIQATDPTELVSLSGIWQSINDGMSKREDWFEIEESPAGGDELKTGRSKPKKGRKKAAKAVAAADNEPAPEPEPEPDPMEDSKAARQEAGEFFGNDLEGEAGQDDTAPATKTDLSLIEQLANMKLSEAGADQTDRNRYRIKSFACMGEDIKEISSPTHGEARTIAEMVKGLTKSDVKEAVEAD